VIRRAIGGIAAGAMANPWALSATQLKPLDSAGLLFFALRNARRAAPWWSDEARERCERLCARVLDAARDQPVDAAATRALTRSVLDASAAQVQRATTAEEPLVRATNYAVCALDAAVEAALAAERPTRVKAVIHSAKYCASLVISLAHAGALDEQAPRADAVDRAGDAVWNAIRSDIALVAQRPAQLETLHALDALGPLWDGDPRWASPARLRR
jgi:hypothetical protein